MSWVWQWQVGGEAGNVGAEAGAGGEHLPGVFVLPGDTWIVGAAGFWPDVRGER